ncbi:branched-chain amino acid ABC transporter permease [Neobacillus sp. NPDC097160]|uniref:branched-chain amino acid ABC transporter permease n=1 Tax=Neobacillus sp. NPDC097160 TaxID=3364298 RepID=UPI003823C796
MIKKFFTWDFNLLLLFILVAPFILGESYFFDTINIIGIYIIAVIGLNLILGVAGLISMGHAAFFGLGAYFSAYISINLHMNPFFSVLISCALVALIAFLLSFPLLRLSGYFLALGTIAIGVIAYTLVNGGGDLTGGPSGLVAIPEFSIGNFSFNSNNGNFYLIWITVLLVFLLSKNLMNSKEGRAMKAIHSDENAAATFGIDVFGTKIKIFTLGSTLGALAGGYYAHYMLFISPEIISLNASIDILIMSFLGGLGSFMGPVFGAFLFQVIPQISAMAQEYETLIQGVIFLLVIIFFTGGVQSVIDRCISLFKHKKGNKNTHNVQV